jgi:hypothetical protein
VISPCTVQIPLKNIPAHVIVIRDGQRLRNPPKPSEPPTGTTPPGTTPTGTTPTGTTPTPYGVQPPPPPAPQGLFLQVGDQIRVAHPAVFTFAYDGNRYRIPHGSVTLECKSLRIGRTPVSPGTGVLAVDLKSGRISVRAGLHAREALVLSPEMMAFATVPHTNFVVDRNPGISLTSAHTLDQLIITADASNPNLRINTRASYTALANRHGIRLNVWQFDPSPLQRPTTSADRLPPFWAGGVCTAGCLPGGTIPGWPLKPFHQQHAIRAGIDELRPANFHVAVDIEANNFQPVFAIQSGVASVSATGSYGDSKVVVGSFTYWHISPTVASGQYVAAYKTEVGAVENGFGHVALSEGGDNDYLNPLRPGGPLRPYTDTEAPVIGVPEIFADGRVIDRAFDPQSFIHKTSYLTPVLAPAALAWRLYNSRGRAITGLEWALNSSGYISPSLKPVVFAPGASNPGFGCFYTQLICIPNWVYNLAGGLTEPLPFGSMSPGRYRLTIYAWNFAGNTSALDYWFKFPSASSASVNAHEFGPLDPNFDP